MGLVDLDDIKLGNGDDFPPTENFLKLKFTQGQINWLAQALNALNEAAGDIEPSEPIVRTYEPGDGINVRVIDDNTSEISVKIGEGRGLKFFDGIMGLNDNNDAFDVDESGIHAITATSNRLGMVSVGDGLKVDGAGRLSLITQGAPLSMVQASFTDSRITYDWLKILGDAPFGVWTANNTSDNPITVNAGDPITTSLPKIVGSTVNYVAFSENGNFVACGRLEVNGRQLITSTDITFPTGFTYIIM